MKKSKQIVEQTFSVCEAFAKLFEVASFFSRASEASEASRHDLKISNVVLFEVIYSVVLCYVFVVFWFDVVDYVSFCLVVRVYV